MPLQMRNGFAEPGPVNTTRGHSKEAVKWVKMENNNPQAGAQRLLFLLASKKRQALCFGIKMKPNILAP